MPRNTSRNRNDDNGWKPHWMRRRDGQGGWTILPAECRFLHFTDERSKRIMALAGKPVEEMAAALGMSVRAVERHATTRLYYYQKDFPAFS